MIAREMVYYITSDEIDLIIGIAKALQPFEEEVAQNWHDLCVKSKNIHQAKERPVRNFKSAVRLLLTSLSNGDFDGYLKRIQKRGVEFAKSKEKYENLIIFFHLYEDAVLPYLQKAFPQRIDQILRILEHLYHGIIAIMSRAYFTGVPPIFSGGRGE
jgi:hypothetical protein